jgi:2-phospho-L-lactate guanylyltransferase
MTDCAPFTWTVVIPVKVLSRAKSRLAALAGPRRAEMALAFACDTVSAVLAVPDVTRVVVVTADPVARRELEALGAEVAADDQADGLNGALRLGARFADLRDAGARGAADAADARGGATGTARVGLAADLPALRTAELARALGHIRRAPAFIPDAQNTGTTLYATPPGFPFLPMFGGRSRERHARHGNAELRLDDVPGLRRDVDTPEDLLAAVALGVGPRTAAVAAELLACAGHAGADLRCAQPDRSASA